MMSTVRAAEASTRTRAWLSTRWSRLNEAPRHMGVDLARGIALIGMLAAHLMHGTPISLTDPSTWYGLAAGRSSVLFATLAGVSIGLVTGGITPLTGRSMRVARGRLVVRAVLLWVIGVLLAMTGVPIYVILPAYALLFLLGTLFVGLRARALFVAAAVVGCGMAFVQPLLNTLPFWSTEAGRIVSTGIGWHYPFTVWLAFVLAGMGIARLDLRQLSVQWRLLVVGFVLAGVGMGLDELTGIDPRTHAQTYWGSVWTGAAHSSGLLEVVGTGGFAVLVLAGCLLLCRTKLTWLVLPVRAAGGMPLTAYVAQVVVWAAWAQSSLGYLGDLAGFRALEPFVPMTLGLLVACTAWALLIGRGPLEELTAALTRVVVPAIPRLPR